MKSNSKETDRIKEPSKFAIKFANIVLFLGLIFGLFLVVYSVITMINIYPTDVHLSGIKIILSIIIIILIGAVLKVNVNLRVNISLMLFSSMIIIYTLQLTIMIN